MRTPIHTPEAPKPLGPYSQGMIAAPFVYTAEQLGLKLDGTMPPDIETQTENSINHIRAILNVGGCTLADVVSVTVYISDLSNFAALDDVYSKRFPKPYPARSIIQTAFPLNTALMAMNAVAVQP